MRAEPLAPEAPVTGSVTEHLRHLALLTEALEAAGVRCGLWMAAGTSFVLVDTCDWTTANVVLDDDTRLYHALGRPTEVAEGGFKVRRWSRGGPRVELRCWDIGARALSTYEAA